jgi:hypothetical protein
MGQPSPTPPRATIGVGHEQHFIIIIIIIGAAPGNVLVTDQCPTAGR